MKYSVFFVFISIPACFLSSTVVPLFFFMVFVFTQYINIISINQKLLFYSVPVSLLSCVFIMVHEIEAELKILVIKPLLL